MLRFSPNKVLINLTLRFWLVDVTFFPNKVLINCTTCLKKSKTIIQKYRNPVNPQTVIIPNKIKLFLYNTYIYSLKKSTFCVMDKNMNIQKHIILSFFFFLFLFLFLFILTLFYKCFSVSVSVTLFSIFPIKAEFLANLQHSKVHMLAPESFWSLAPSIPWKISELTFTSGPVKNQIQI